MVDYIQESVLPSIDKKGNYLWTSQDYDIYFNRDDSGLLFLSVSKKDNDKNVFAHYLVALEEDFKKKYDK